MERGGRGEGGGSQVTGRWLHRGETHSVPAGGCHHGPVQTPQCDHPLRSIHGARTCERTLFHGVCTVYVILNTSPCRSCL